MLKTLISKKEIHLIGVKAFSLIAQYDEICIEQIQVESFTHLTDKKPVTNPDFILSLSNGCQSKILVVADQHISSNFFCDLKKLQAGSDYIAYYFINQFKLYLIPCSKLLSWIEANKDNFQKVYRFIKASENIDGYLVKIDLLMEEIPEIVNFNLN